MQKYICDCCGGKIDLITLKCEYCGTQYKNEFDNLIKIETFTNPVDTYKGRVIISRQTLKQMGETVASEYVINTLTRELSKAIASNMVIELRNDIGLDAQIFDRTIKVIRPERIDSGWYKQF